MRVALLLLMLSFSCGALAGEPVEGPSGAAAGAPQGEAVEEIQTEAPLLEDAPLPIEPSAAQRLEEAVRAYQEGRPEEAQVALARLVMDESVEDRELRQQARVYLGEVLYVQGEQDAAFRAFELVLIADPAYRIDPFRHPPDVCGFFEVVRASIAPLRPAEPLVRVPPPRLPASTLAGFGLYQLSHGHPGRGLPFTIGQTALGITSGLTYGLLMSERRWETDPELARLERLRWLQWGATTGFWALHLGSFLDARQVWRRDEVPATRAAVSGPQISYTAAW